MQNFPFFFEVQNCMENIIVGPEPYDIYIYISHIFVFVCLIASNICSLANNVVDKCLQCFNPNKVANNYIFQYPKTMISHARLAPE